MFLRSKKVTLDFGFTGFLLGLSVATVSLQISPLGWKPIILSMKYAFCSLRYVLCKKAIPCGIRCGIQVMISLTG